MLWTTMHWTRFVQPGWRALPCTDASVPTGRCALAGGGNYAAMASPDSGDIAIIVHAFRHNTSKCIRCDPPDWTVADKQAVSFALGGLSPAKKAVHVWRSCTGWEYPSATDGWFEQQPDASVSAGGALNVEIEADCMYTFTTIGGVTKPPVPATTPHSAAFPLPYEEDFDGMLVGAEAPYFGDQMDKFETVAAGGGRSGNASRQQLPLGTWPICNRGHSQPLSIIGDFFFADVQVSADILIETAGVRFTPLKNGGDHSFGSRFGPLRNRPPVLWCHFLDSSCQDGENSEKTEKKRAKMGEIWPNKKSAGRRPILDG